MPRRKRSRATSHIPPSYVELFRKIQAVVIEAHVRWLTFRELFATSQRRVDLLNECAGPFFVIVHNALLGDIQRAVCKLSDPAESCGRSNLSLAQMQQHVEQVGNKAVAAKCRRLLARIQRLAKRFRYRRHKTLAHLDLATALGAKGQRLPKISCKAIEDTLLSIRSYLNAIEVHYDDTETAYGSPIIHAGAAALTAALRAGLRYQELVRAGGIPAMDWRSSAWADA